MAALPSVISYTDISEQSYTIIKKEIVTGKMHAGARLNVVEIAKQLGISRTPVSYALSKLSSEGLVDDVPRKGYYVSKLSGDEVAELLQVLLILQLGAVEAGVKLVDSRQVARLRRLLDELQALIGDDGGCTDIVEWIRVASQFDLLVVAIARNKRLVETARSLNIHLHLARMRFEEGRPRDELLRRRRAQRALDERRAIVDALDDQNLAAAKAAITAHNLAVNEELRVILSLQDTELNVVSATT